jgi:hypothetical protein
LVFAIFALAAVALDALVVVAFAILPSRIIRPLFCDPYQFVRYSNYCAESEPGG